MSWCGRQVFGYRPTDSHFDDLPSDEEKCEAVVALVPNGLDRRSFDSVIRDRHLQERTDALDSFVRARRIGNFAVAYHIVGHNDRARSRQMK